MKSTGHIIHEVYPKKAAAFSCGSPLAVLRTLFYFSSEASSSSFFFFYSNACDRTCGNSRHHCERKYVVRISGLCGRLLGLRSLARATARTAGPGRCRRHLLVDHRDLLDGFSIDLDSAVRLKCEGDRCSHLVSARSCCLFQRVLARIQTFDRMDILVSVK